MAYLTLNRVRIMKKRDGKGGKGKKRREERGKEEEKHGVVKMKTFSRWSLLL
jgi:hypothetical protein